MSILRTRRLTLHRFTGSDAEPMMCVFGDAEAMRYSTTGVRDLEWVREWIGRRIEDWDRHGYGLWAVTVPEWRDNQPIGYCGLTYFPNINGRSEVEVGYRLAHQHWNKGYATEAAIAVRNYAFDVLGLSRLIAIIDPQNERSVRVAKKLGMIHEADVMLKGYTHADHVYSMSKPSR